MQHGKRYVALASIVHRYRASRHASCPDRIKRKTLHRWPGSGSRPLPPTFSKPSISGQCSHSAQSRPLQCVLRCQSSALGPASGARPLHRRLLEGHLISDTVPARRPIAPPGLSVCGLPLDLIRTVNLRWREKKFFPWSFIPPSCSCILRPLCWSASTEWQERSWGLRRCGVMACHTIPVREPSLTGLVAPVLFQTWHTNRVLCTADYSLTERPRVWILKWTAMPSLPNQHCWTTVLRSLYPTERQSIDRRSY